MIYESNATKTARNGSSGNPPQGADKQARAHVDVSRKADRSGNVGVKVNNKNKHETKVKINSDSRKPERGDFPDVNKKNIKKSDKISKFAKPANEVAIIEKSIPVNAQGKVSKHAQKANATEKGLVVRGRDIDPEIALMESRARSMERPKPEVLNNARKNGRSMSGMLGSNRRNPHLMSTKPAAAVSAHEDAKPAENVADEESRFSKMKSMLIGVGVALVVAVVGFAGIAMFGNNKPMCTVHFESNGGSEVEDTEIICGRAVTRPEDPEKEGFTFEGWILDGDPFDFDKTGIYRNSTLVAKWKADDGTEIVTVKFDTDGGSEISNVEIAKGKKVSRPSAPTKWNYVFEDWYFGDKVFDFDEPVNENITLKAKWIKSENNNTVQSNCVTSMSVSSNSFTVEKDQSITIAVKVLPSSADYSLAAISSDEKVVTCSVNKTDVTCTAKAAGKAKVTVRDVNSGNTANFAITVPDQTPPEVVDPPHEHNFVDGTCTECGEKDPDYKEPEPPKHEHTYVDGVCTECGETDPDYVPPHEHNFVDGTCTECGEKDPDYTPEN